jgi:hypothetical protein
MCVAMICKANSFFYYQLQNLCNYIQKIVYNALGVWVAFKKKVCMDIDEDIVYISLLCL